MKQRSFKRLAIFFFTLTLILPFSVLATVHLHPVTWKGQKWEYLVEHPTDIQHIDPTRMEEILDTAGQHGWKLVDVTSEFHFYAFYFTRPLHDHRLKAHRQRLAATKMHRHKREAKTYKMINESLKTIGSK